jgi:hypothetical protein
LNRSFTARHGSKAAFLLEPTTFWSIPMKRIRLKPSTYLQLRFVLGMLVTAPLWVLLYQLPMFRSWPLWVMAGLPAGGMVAGWIWFRQCMSPDKTSFKPKWW